MITRKKLIHLSIWNHIFIDRTRSSGCRHVRTRRSPARPRNVRRSSGRKFICMTSFNKQIRTRDLCTACAARQPCKILLYPSRTHHPHIHLFQVCLIGLGFSGPRQLRLAGAYLFRNLLVKISQVESSWRSAKPCY